MKLTKIINESNLINIPRQMLGGTFAFIKARFLTISYKYSIEYQKAINIEYKRKSNYGIKQINQEFKKLGLLTLENNNAKEFEFSHMIFPLNYQKRLENISPLKLLVITFTKLSPKGYYVNDNIGIKIDQVIRITVDKNKHIMRNLTYREFNLKKTHQYSISFFERDAFTYLKSLSETLEHELTHFIDYKLRKAQKISNIEKVSVDAKDFMDFNVEKYFQSKTEYKTQLLTSYRGLIKYYAHYKITYENLFSAFQGFQNSIILPHWSIYLIYNAIYPQKIEKILKTILNTFYKTGRLLRDNKKEKIYMKKYIKILLSYNKLLKKQRNDKTT